MTASATGSSSSSSGGPAASGSSTSGSSSIQLVDSVAFAERCSFFLDLALLLLALRDLEALLLFELFFAVELFFRALELVLLFDSEEERFGVAAAAKGARALKQKTAARGIASLIIFTK
jgi:hypothetical protein